jgi:hypothetical protein
MKKTVALILAFFLLLSLTPQFNAAAADMSAVAAADTLHSIGLFNGTGTTADGSPEFSLDRALTRQESVTMLVRLLGAEQEAKNGTWQTPFTDLDDWAAPYIGYAYANKLAYGRSPTQFDPGAVVTSAEFMTLVLRALGYSSETDFKWNESTVFSDSIGLTEGEYTGTEGLVRGDAAEVSLAAMTQGLKESGGALIEALIDKGAVTESAARTAGLLTRTEYQREGTRVLLPVSHDLYGGNTISLNDIQNAFPGAAGILSGVGLEDHRANPLLSDPVKTVFLAAVLNNNSMSGFFTPIGRSDRIFQFFKNFVFFIVDKEYNLLGYSLKENLVLNDSSMPFETAVSFNGPTEIDSMYAMLSEKLRAYESGAIQIADSIYNYRYTGDGRAVDRFYVRSAGGVDLSNLYTISYAQTEPFTGEDIYNGIVRAMSLVLVDMTAVPIIDASGRITGYERANLWYQDYNKPLCDEDGNYYIDLLHSRNEKYHVQIFYDDTGSVLGYVVPEPMY